MYPATHNPPDDVGQKCRPSVDTTEAMECPTKNKTVAGHWLLVGRLFVSLHDVCYTANAFRPMPHFQNAPEARWIEI